MAKFRNVGTVDGGVVRFHGAAPAAGGIPTMDAEGVASGGAFLVSELEKRDPLIRKPLTSVTYPRDIPIQTGGGWVDYVSAMSVAYGITGGSGNGPVQAGGSNGLPVVQASVDKGVYKAHVFAVALRVMFQDMQRANFVGRSLDQLLQDGVRMAYDKHNDENVYVGLSEYETTGLINNPDATVSTVADGAKGNGNWATKTPDEILMDINTAITETWAQGEYDLGAMPNHILLPYEEYTDILTRKVSELATETIFDYVMRNNVAVKNGGSCLSARPAGARVPAAPTPTAWWCMYTTTASSRWTSWSPCPASCLRPMWPMSAMTPPIWPISRSLRSCIRRRSPTGTTSAGTPDRRAVSCSFWQDRLCSFSARTGLKNSASPTGMWARSRSG